MAKILSIDFDYFIDASNLEREIYFPRGGDEIPSEQLKTIWQMKHAQYSQLPKIGVIEQFYTMKNYLMLLEIKKDNFYNSDSHKNIKKLIDTIPKSSQLSIVNVDFHHDYYHYYSGGQYLNCGNWLRRVVEERPNTLVKWIRREDSQIYSLEGEFPFQHTTDLTSVLSEGYDYIFICRSPEWSPPHLGKRYDELVRAALDSQIA